MQDLTATTKALNDILGAIKSAGWLAIAALLIIGAVLIAKPLLNRQRKATQEVNVTVPTPAIEGPDRGTPTCSLHSGVVAQLDELHQFRSDNKADHEKIFDKLDGLSTAVIGAVNDAAQAAAAATSIAQRRRP
jgi:hypothetical protein